MKESREDTITRFESLLLSYAKSNGLARKCNGMRRVEEILLTLVDNGVNQIHTNEVLIALAGLMSYLSFLQFSTNDMAYDEEYIESMHNMREEAIGRSAKWLVSNGWIWLIFWKPYSTCTKAKKLLTWLMAECSLSSAISPFPPP
ncbi:MAG: hypothetical protein V1848_02335 [Candidatus Magasanikbacteria bacterium]